MQPLLDTIRDVSVEVDILDEYDEEGMAFVCITFQGGFSLKCCFWRLLNQNKRQLSSFDHQQKYGLVDSINAKSELKKLIDGIQVSSVTLDDETGDLVVQFLNGFKFQALNLTGYEDWAFHFADENFLFSNYI
jgi:hypothetical protein